MRMLTSTIACSCLLLGANAANSTLPSNETAVVANAIEAATNCTECYTVLCLLQGVANLGDDAFVELFTELCVALKVDDRDVCVGEVSQSGPILAYDLREMDIPSDTAQSFCATFFGLCPYPDVAPFDLSIPSPVASATCSQPVASSQAPIQIVHFSDIHVDPFYETGANSNCTKSICCRPYTSSDAPGNNSNPAGPFGNTKCDAPVSLEESMYAAIQQIAPQATLSIFTGDIVDHAVWLVTEDQNMIDINDAYTRMSGLPRVYGVVGNHEAAPVNSFPPLGLNVTPSEQWLYDELATDWSKWIQASADYKVHQFGAYSSKVPDSNLRIISINTNLYYINNYWLYENTMEADPSGQLAWVIKELQAAETAGEKVYIIGHMPMGQHDAFHDGSHYFNLIVERYSSTISALFFGHTHVDQFEIAYSDYTAQSFSNALAVSYICPSMTPTSGPPAFRIFTVDPITYGILDIDTYIANISDANYQNGPQWIHYYSAKEAYGPVVSPPLTDPASELTPAFWHNVTVAMENNDDVFNAYFSRQNRGFHDTPCTADCKTQEICGIRAADAQFNCLQPTPGIHFEKRDEGLQRTIGGKIRESICEGTRIKHIIAAIVGGHGVLEEGLQRARRKVRI